MIILEKKKILYAISIISMFIFTFVLTSNKINNNKMDSKIDVKTVQTVALPVNKKTIVLDAGHRYSR